jgi:hypothetical protein
MMTAEQMWKQVEVSLGVRWILHGDLKVKAERDEWRAHKDEIIAHMAKMQCLAKGETP